MYDSLLFGNGLSIALLNKYLNNYLSFNDFAKDFVLSQNEDKILFYKMLGKNLEINKIKRIEELLFLEYENLKFKGFEAWTGFNIFNEKYDKEDFAVMTTYVYAMYNWWYIKIYKELIDKNVNFQDSINKIKSKIKGRLYTLNFDLLLDNYFKIDHLHGRFIYPLESLKEITYFINGEKFEYSYLYGTNGFEKLNRLKIINDLYKKQCLNLKHYDLDFFYNKNIKLGNLLIYGISFSESNVIPLQLKDKYDDFYLLNSVDGHLIFRLDAMCINNQIDKLTLAYYSEKDKKNYEKIFNNNKYLSMNFYKKLFYVKCKDIDLI